jgi:hypothetical protein
MQVERIELCSARVFNVGDATSDQLVCHAPASGSVLVKPEETDHLCNSVEGRRLCIQRAKFVCRRATTKVCAARPQPSKKSVSVRQPECLWHNLG